MRAPSSIVLADGGDGIVLAADLQRDPAPGPFYQANGGWLAFTRPDLAGTLQVWLRSPAGVETQASSFGSESMIEQLSPDGEVAFRSAATGVDRRYRAAPGAAAVDIGSALGRLLYIGGQLHLILGGTLFRVD